MKYGHWSGHRSKIWQIRESELFRTSLSSILLLPKSKLKFRKLFGKLKIPRNSITNVSVAFQVNRYLLRFSFWFGWIPFLLEGMILDQMANKEYLFDKVKRAFKTHNEKKQKNFWIGFLNILSWIVFRYCLWKQLIYFSSCSFIRGGQGPAGGEIESLKSLKDLKKFLGRVC